MKFPQFRKPTNLNAARSLVILICVSTFASFVPAQRSLSDSPFAKSATSAEIQEPSGVDTLAPSAIVFEHENVTCAQLDAIPNTSYGGVFSSIISGDQLKLNSGGPFNGTYQFRTIGIAELTGNPPVPPPNYKTINVVTSGNNITSFSSQVQITAVIIKVGNDSYVYPYTTVTYGDTNLISRVSQGISHLSFCYGLAVAPTAAPASVSGRVVDSFGYGISNARILVTNASDGSTRTAISNPFGYYSVDNLSISEFYVTTVSHKRYTFSDDTRSFSLNEDMAGIDFIANP